MILSTRVLALLLAIHLALPVALSAAPSRAPRIIATVSLSDFQQAPTASGYSFSKMEILPFNDDHTDMFFEGADRKFVMRVSPEASILDLGATASLGEAAAQKMEVRHPSRRVSLSETHAYQVTTKEGRIHTFRVVSVTPAQVVFQWAVRGPLLRLPREYS